MNNCIHTHISITYENIENFLPEKTRQHKLIHALTKMFFTGNPTLK